MAFDPVFAHDVLALIAESAYVAAPPVPLPPGYSVAGQIVMDMAKMQTLVAAAAPNHQQMIQKLLAPGNAFGWVVQNLATGVVVVTFRGTESVEDWLHNLDFVQEPYQIDPAYGSVHKGFQLYYLTLRDSVLNLLNQADAACTRLIVTGHSLGAAISELAAPDLLKAGIRGLKPEVQNFAGPRVGAPDFAASFNRDIPTCFRVVNIWDIVPRLPPLLLPPFLFEHVGLEVKIDGGFTLDELVAHSMEQSYGPGLAKLMAPPLPVSGLAAVHAALGGPVISAVN
jgi:triacylglycerol lipase